MFKIREKEISGEAMRKEFVVMRELLNRQELFDIMADMMMDRAFVYISEIGRAHV